MIVAKIVLNSRFPLKQHSSVPSTMSNEIIKTLKDNYRLSFLRAQYSNVDELSLNQQKNVILSNLEKNRFADVESGLQSLYSDSYFLNLDAAEKVKKRIPNIEYRLLNDDLLKLMFCHPFNRDASTRHYQLYPIGIDLQESTLK